jgi:hypothetical protein
VFLSFSVERERESRVFFFSFFFFVKIAHVLPLLPFSFSPLFLSFVLICLLWKQLHIRRQLDHNSLSRCTHEKWKEKNHFFFVVVKEKITPLSFFV